MSEKENPPERSRVRRNQAVGIVVMVLGWGLILLLALAWLSDSAGF